MPYVLTFKRNQMIFVNSLELIKYEVKEIKREDGPSCDPNSKRLMLVIKFSDSKG